MQDANTFAGVQISRRRREAAEFTSRLHKGPLSISFRGLEWRIGATVSEFLVAEGSGWSLPYGIGLFIQLANGREIDDSDPLRWVVK